MAQGAHGCMQLFPVSRVDSAHESAAAAPQPRNSPVGNGRAVSLMSGNPSGVAGSHTASPGTGTLHLDSSFLQLCSAAIGFAGRCSHREIERENEGDRLCFCWEGGRFGVALLCRASRLSWREATTALPPQAIGRSSGPVRGIVGGCVVLCRRASRVRRSGCAEEGGRGGARVGLGGVCSCSPTGAATAHPRHGGAAVCVSGVVSQAVLRSDRCVTAAGVETPSTPVHHLRAISCRVVAYNFTPTLTPPPLGPCPADSHARRPIHAPIACRVLSVVVVGLTVCCVALRVALRACVGPLTCLSRSGFASVCGCCRVRPCAGHGPRHAACGTVVHLRVPRLLLPGRVPASGHWPAAIGSTRRSRLPRHLHQLEVSAHDTAIAHRPLPRDGDTCHCHLCG